MFGLLIGLIIGIAALTLGFLEGRKAWRRLIWRPKELPPPIEIGESRFVDITDHRIHYIQRGVGPNLVLVHGIGANIICWRDVIEALALEFRVTALDLPGFGQSQVRTEGGYTLDGQAKRLNEFLAKLGIQKTSVLACSMGGAISTWAATLEPDRYDKLVLIAPVLNHKVARIHPRRFVWLYPKIKDWIATPRVVQSIYKYVARDPATLEILWEYYRPYHNQPDRVWPFLRSLFIIADPRLPNALAKLKPPMLVLWGQSDKLNPFRYYDEIMSLLPEHKTAIHDTGGHHLMCDEPGWVVSQTIGFLKPDLEAVKSVH